MHGHQSLEDLHEVIVCDGAFVLDRRGSFDKLIGTSQDLQHPGISGLVGREFQWPHMVRELHPQPIPRSGGGPGAGRFFRYLCKSVLAHG